MPLDSFERARPHREVLVLAVWDVLVRFGVAVLLGQAKIDDVDLVGALTQPHEEVVGLDIPMDEALGVDVLDAADLRAANGGRQRRLSSRPQPVSKQRRARAGAAFRRTSWSASISTVFSENLRLQKLNKSSRLGPSKSSTMMLYSPSTPNQRTLGMPAAPGGRDPSENARQRDEMRGRGRARTAALQNLVELGLVQELRVLRLHRLLRTMTEFRQNGPGPPTHAESRGGSWGCVPA